MAHFKKPGPKRQTQNGRADKKENSDSFYVSGRRPVESLLSRCATNKTQDALESLMILGTKESLSHANASLVEAAQQLGLAVKYCTDPAQFPAPADENHQKICLLMKSYPTSDLHALAKTLATLDLQSMRGCVGVVVDQIQDPRNFGAILRSAAFFGQKFVIFGKDRQSPLSPLVFRSSAGGATELDLVQVTNITRALEELKELGLWVIVTACDEKSIEPALVPRDRPYVLVLGNEEKGVRPEILKAADYRMRIQGGSGTLDSLNVSVATGVALYALQNNGVAKV